MTSFERRGRVRRTASPSDFFHLGLVPAVAGEWRLDARN